MNLRADKSYLQNAPIEIDPRRRSPRRVPRPPRPGPRAPRLPASGALFAQSGVPLPAITGPANVLLEAVGGVAIILDLAVPIVGVLIAVNMAGAWMFVHTSPLYSMGHNGPEVVIAIGLLSLALAAVGSGRFEIGHLITQRRCAAADAASPPSSLARGRGVRYRALRNLSSASPSGCLVSHPDDCLAERHVGRPRLGGLAHQPRSPPLPEPPVAGETHVSSASSPNTRGSTSVPVDSLTSRSCRRPSRRRALARSPG